MRLLLSFLTVSCLAFAPACGGDDSSSPKGDLAGVDDLSARVVDSATQQACGALLVAANACSDQACVNAVVATGTPEAQTKFEALFACAAAQCNPSDAGGAGGPAGTCSGPDDTTPACAACVKAQAKSIACGSEGSACFNDTGT